VTWRLKARVVEQIDAAIARQRRNKYVSVATDTDATVEDVVFSMQSVLRLYNKVQLDNSSHDSGILATSEDRSCMTPRVMRQ
jgi:hypothetical protein